MPQDEARPAGGETQGPPGLDAVAPAPTASEAAKAREGRAEQSARKTPHERNLERLREAKLQAEIERAKVETDTLLKKNLILDREIDRLKSDNLMRGVASVVFCVIVIGWLVAVWVVLFNNNVITTVPDPSAPDRARAVSTPRLSDPVLIAALGTTTLNVVVLLHIVAKYLFPQVRSGDAGA